MSTYDDFTIDPQPAPTEAPSMSDLADYQPYPEECLSPEVGTATPDDSPALSTTSPDEAVTPFATAPWPQTAQLAELQEDADKWFVQNTNFTCGPAAVTQILEDFTGQQFDNELLVAQDAAQLGWLGDTGMPLEAVDDLLTRWGVPSHVEQAGPDPYSAFQTVDQYLDEGRSVVLFVDSSEYAQTPTDGDTYHFTRILDVDVQRGVAVLSDSGRPDGQGLEVPLSTLAEAWNEGLENQNAPTYGMVVSDVADPDGVGMGEAAPGTPAAGTDAGVLAPGEPFCLLPITVSPEGYQEVVSCCGEDPAILDDGLVTQSPPPPAGPTVTIASDSPFAATPPGPPSGPDITIASDSPFAPPPPGPDAGPTVHIQPEDQPITLPTDVDTATGPFMDDVVEHMREMRERNTQQPAEYDPGFDPSTSIGEGIDTIDNAAAEMIGTVPQDHSQTTNPLTNQTAHVPEGSTTPSLPPTISSDPPPGVDNTP